MRYVGSSGNELQQITMNYLFLKAFGRMRKIYVSITNKAENLDIGHLKSKEDFMRKFIIALVAGLLLATAGASLAMAQQVYNGSIRGTVYLDENGDGECVDTGEPTHPGVPIEFVSNDGEWSTFLATGDNGTYGLVAAAYGTWTVSARPNANDFVVTSETTQSVFIGEEEPVALNVDFCIQEIDGPIAESAEIATFTPTTTTFLPASGAAADNAPYYVALAAGLLLVLAGGALQFIKRTN